MNKSKMDSREIRITVHQHQTASLSDRKVALLVHIEW